MNAETYQMGGKARTEGTAERTARSCDTRQFQTSRNRRLVGIGTMNVNRESDLRLVVVKREPVLERLVQER